LRSSSASQEIPSSVWNPNIHYRIHKRPPLVCIPIHSKTTHSLESRSYFMQVPALERTAASISSTEYTTYNLKMETDFTPKHWCLPHRTASHHNGPSFRKQFSVLFINWFTYFFIYHFSSLL